MNATDEALVQAQETILLLQEELAATNREVMLLTLELEQRVEQRTAQLQSANQELEAFSYSVSHDLRAPLRHIQGFSAILSQSAVNSNLNPRGRELIGNIQEAANKMSALIESLLEFSRTGRAELRKTNVDLNKLVQEAIRTMEPDLAGKNIIWEIAPLPSVIGDATLLSQVWTNLLANAVKYSRLRNPARIEVGQTTPESGASVFFVKDNGVGFDMKYADKLFGVFQRLHTNKEFEGTGVGLANVRRIISRHGGRVWAEAKPDAGATFYFSLPKS